MKKLYWIIIFLLLMVKVSFAQNLFTGQLWLNNHIQFSYSQDIADNATYAFYPKTDTTPEWTEARFENYDESGNWVQTGGYVAVGLLETLPPDQAPLAIYDVFKADFLSDALSESYQSWNPNIKEALTTISQARYLNSDYVDGIRFVTQDATTNQAIYVFDGVTLDNKYGVSVFIPLESIETESNNPIGLIDDIVASLVITTPDILLTDESQNFVDYQAIQFSYDSDLAYRIQVDFEPEFLGEDEPIPGGYTVHPAWTIFSFVNQEQWWSPSLTVADIENFPETDSIFRSNLNNLIEILDNPVDLEARIQRVMTLPAINASPQIIEYLDYLEFDGVRGIRFITNFAQEASPLTATDFTYIFIGLSTDGNRLIGVRFPLYLDTLPLDIPEDIDWTEFYENYDSYLEEIQAEIALTPQDAFVPSIGMIDEMIASIQTE